MHPQPTTRLLVLTILLLLFAVIPLHALAKPLQVSVTVAELGGLVEAIGGDLVSVTVFAKGTEDPHYLDARPSFVRTLSSADLFVQVGLDLEAAWAPLLLRSSRNGRIQPGRPGYLDASQAIDPLDIPAGPVDRGMGDVHPEGNPHYLADPLNGLKVAALLRDRLIALQPQSETLFRGNFDRFRQRLGDAMVGADLAAIYDFEKLALLHQHGKLESFLRQQGELGRLSGWLGELLPFYGSQILTYHKSWSYFATRFGLIVAGQLEPKPGIPSGPGHLLQVIRAVKAKQIRVLLTEPWMSPQATQAVAGKTGITVVRAATSLVPGRDGYDYIDAVGSVVEQVAEGLRGGRN